jgi:hypothetical protein
MHHAACVELLRDGGWGRLAVRIWRLVERAAFEALAGALVSRLHSMYVGRGISGARVLGLFLALDAAALLRACSQHRH